MSRLLSEMGACSYKQCVRTGKPRSLADEEKKCRWSYRLCDHHFATLSDAEKLEITRKVGMKGL